MKHHSTFLFGQGETQAVYPMPSSFSRQAPADACKEPSWDNALNFILDVEINMKSFKGEIVRNGLPASLFSSKISSHPLKY